MKRFNLFIGAALLALGLAPAAHAVVTEKVVQDSFAAFSAGDFDNVSLSSDGHLELAPGITNLASVTDPIIWAAVQDSQGNIFFGTGNQGKVYKLTPKGELSTFFAPNEIMVHALAIDSKGRLYAATSPNGRVYRLDSKGQAEVYCTPGETYIWAMTFGKDGTLYLATGDHGKILRVAPGQSTPAKVETYFETTEANITALAMDMDGNLLAGTSPHGYLYRIDKANHGFVVFNSSEKEIKQITVAPGGMIFVSTFSESAKEGQSSGSGPTDEATGQSDNSTKADSASKAPPPAAAGSDDAVAVFPPGMVISISSQGNGNGRPPHGIVYRIDTTGFYERYWSAPDAEAIYSMILLRDGSLLVGTGDKGRIYSITDAHHWKLLQQTSDGSQVAALLPGSGTSKQYFAATSHPAKLYRLDFSLAESGTYTSKALDAKQPSQWGRLHPDGSVPDGTKLEFSTRSGNTAKPEKTWSDWSDSKPLSSEITVTSPTARYFQYRVQFKRDAASPSATAQLRRVKFYYQNENAAPVIARIKVITKGFGVSQMAGQQMEMPTTSFDQLLNDGANNDPPSDASPALAEMNALAAMAAHPPMKLTKAPGLCTVVWEASDPNGDKLTYSVAIRAESDKYWTKLVDKTKDAFYSFDTTGFHQGLYYIKVTASDLPSNTPETAKTTESISDAFMIDNTPPALSLKKHDVTDDSAQIAVDASDVASVINSAGYSLDGKDEVALRPDGLIFDSTNDTFTIELNNLDKGMHSFLLRVSDEASNTSVLKLNFEVK